MKKNCFIHIPDSRGILEDALNSTESIIYLRSMLDNDIEFWSKAFELDTETKEVKNIWTDTSGRIVSRLHHSKAMMNSIILVPVQPIN